MPYNFVEVLRAEINDLEAALSVDLRYKRLSELRRVLALYQDEPSSRKFIGAVPTHHHPVNQYMVDRPPQGRRVNPDRARALEVAKMFLANRVGPTPTRDILDHLQSLGISIQGNVPVNNLSAMLSNSDEFHSHGRDGWTLRSPSERAVAALWLGTLRSVAETVLADVDSERLRETYVALMRNDEIIPQDLDGRLLATARAKIDRDLEEHEKRELRSVFRDMVDKSLSDSERAALRGTLS